MQGVSPELPGPGAAIADFDLAIDSLLKRIDSAPENLELHKQLRDVGLRRKVAGGKSAGGFLGPTLPYAGKNDKEKMLNAEYVLAKDIGNVPAMMDVYRSAEAAGYQDVMEWIGQILKAVAIHTKGQP
jgi:hypothetical protein